MAQTDFVSKAGLNVPHTDSLRGTLTVSFLTERTGELANKFILDLGAGHGAISIPLAKTGARVFCVDIQDMVLRSLR